MLASYTALTLFNKDIDIISPNDIVLSPDKIVMESPHTPPQSEHSEIILKDDSVEKEFEELKNEYPAIDEVIIEDFWDIESSLKEDIEERIQHWQRNNLTIYLIEQVAEISQYDDIITGQALEHDIPKTRIYSLIRNESLGIRTAKSPMNAGGLTQLMPLVAESFKLPINKFVDYRYFPQSSIEAGVDHISSYYEHLENDWVLSYISYCSSPRVAARLKGKDWLTIRNFLDNNYRDEVTQYIINNFALTALLLNPAEYEIVFSKKPLLSELTFEYIIEPEDTINSVIEKFGVTYKDLEYYNRKTHKAFGNSELGLKSGYKLLVPKVSGSSP